MITGVTVELLEFLAQRPVLDFTAEVIERFGHFQPTVAPEFVVTGQSVVTSALDVQRCQILRDQMRRPE